MVRVLFFFSSIRRHTRWNCDWSSVVCSSDLASDQSADQAKPQSQQQAEEQRRERNREQGRAERIPVRPGAPRKDRSEERRVGKERMSRCSTSNDKMNMQNVISKLLTD